MIGIEEFIEEFILDFIYFEFWVKNIIYDIVVDNDGFVVFGDCGKLIIIKENLSLNYKRMFIYRNVELYGLVIDNNGFIFVNGKDSGKIYILLDDGYCLKIFDIDLL